VRLPVRRVFYRCVCCHVIDRDPARNPEPAEPVPEDEASWLACPDDDHAWEADADGYPEPDDWASSGEPPVELDAEAEE
jgi:hypothetical protein